MSLSSCCYAFVLGACDKLLGICISFLARAVVIYSTFRYKRAETDARDTSSEDKKLATRTARL